MNNLYRGSVPVWRVQRKADRLFLYGLHSWSRRWLIQDLNDWIANNPGTKRRDYRTVRVTVSIWENSDGTLNANAF